MNHLTKLTSEAIEINLKDTFTFLDDFSKPKTGIIESEYPTINGLSITFYKAERGIIFETPPILSTVAPAIYQGVNYGFTKTFKIKCGSQILIVKDGVGELKIKFGKGFSTEGTLYDLETEKFRTQGFFRAIFPIDGFTQVPLKYLLGKPFKVGESYRLAGLISVVCNDFDLQVFDYEKDKEKYLFIDCKTEVTYPVFEKILESIIYSYGFISGNLIRNEVVILKSKNNSFISSEEFHFRKVEDSIKSSLELINPQEHKDYHNLKSKQYFPLETFSNLIFECLTNNTFLRTIRIITQARNQPIEIQIASTFVAMETIKELIINKNLENIRPFKDKTKAAFIIAALKKIIVDTNDVEFNDKTIVLSKIENLNSIGNNDSFKIAFKLMGINLTSDDVKCISMRNRFLHGNSPHENEPEEVRIQELTKIQLNAHLLTCALILKYVGYKGVIKNMLKYLDIINERRELKQELFRTI